jgi:hypothetical protein
MPTPTYFATGYQNDFNVLHEIARQVTDVRIPLHLGVKRVDFTVLEAISEQTRRIQTTGLESAQMLQLMHFVPK